jgi:hypothetical protein
MRALSWGCIIAMVSWIVWPFSEYFQLADLFFWSPFAAAALLACADMLDRRYGEQTLDGAHIPSGRG